MAVETMDPLNLAGTIVLALALITVPAQAPSSISAEIDVPSEVRVPLEGYNETILTIEGTFMVTSLTGADQFLALQGRIEVTGGIYEADVQPREFPSVEGGIAYGFRVTVTLPPDAWDEGSSVHTIKLVLTNVRGDTDVIAQLTVRPILAPANGDEGGFKLPIQKGDFPWGLLVFVLGMAVLVTSGIIWSFRNLELVREVGGERRIMLREKKSGRLIKGRLPPRQ